MKIKKCSCGWCKTGLRTRKNSRLVKHLKRAARHKAKQDLKQGKDPETRVFVPYTD